MPDRDPLRDGLRDLYAAALPRIAAPGVAHARNRHRRRRATRAALASLAALAGSLLVVTIPVDPGPGEHPPPGGGRVSEPAPRCDQEAAARMVRPTRGVFEAYYEAFNAPQCAYPPEAPRLQP